MLIAFLICLLGERAPVSLIVLVSSPPLRADMMLSFLSCHSPVVTDSTILILITSHDSAGLRHPSLRIEAGIGAGSSKRGGRLSIMQI